MDAKQLYQILEEKIDTSLSSSPEEVLKNEAQEFELSFKGFFKCRVSSELISSDSGNIETGETESKSLRKRIIRWVLYLPDSGGWWREFLTLYEDNIIKGYPVQLIGYGLQENNGKSFLITNRAENITADNASNLKTKIQEFYDQETTQNLIKALLTEAKQAKKT